MICPGKGMEISHFFEKLRAGNELITVVDPMTCGDIPAYVMAEESERNRAVLFANITDYQSSVAFNTYGSQRRINRAIGADDTRTFFNKIDRAIDAPKSLNLGSRDNDYSVTSKPNLSHHIPAIFSSRHDATPYITSGVVLACDPDSGRHHLCFVRMSIQKSNRLLINPRTFRIRDIAAKTIGQGKPLDIVILIGAPAEVMIMGCLSLPDEVDELEVAQALAADSLAFIERGLPIPIDTEMVLFGQVLPGESKQEGPFGELTGLYSRHPANPVCVISELWAKENFIYHNILGGQSREHVLLCAQKGKHDLEHLKAGSPHVLDYHLPRFAAGQLCLLTVAEGFAKETLIDKLCDVALIKFFVLINEDTDPQFSDDVLWAMTQRTRKRSDYHFRDANPTRGLAEKIVIDATANDLCDWNDTRIETVR